MTFTHICQRRDELASSVQTDRQELFFYGVLTMFQSDKAASGHMTLTQLHTGLGAGLPWLLFNFTAWFG